MGFVNPGEGLGFYWQNGTAQLALIPPFSWHKLGEGGRRPEEGKEKTLHFKDYPYLSRVVDRLQPIEI